MLKQLLILIPSGLLVRQILPAPNGLVIVAASRGHLAAVLLLPSVEGWFGDTHLAAHPRRWVPPSACFSANATCWSVNWLFLIASFSLKGQT
jgi:hypothetical protein